MRWVTYTSPSDGLDRAGLLRNGNVHGVDGAGSVLDLLTSGGLAAAEREAVDRPHEVLPVDRVRLRAPIPVPPSVRDFLSFEEHLANSTKAMGGTIDPLWYEQPVFYFTNPAAIRGPAEDIEIPPGCAAFDYELEIGAVVGKAGADLSPAEAGEHIAGYLLFCDWTARDLQAAEMRLHLGPAKGKDSATSIGPVLVTPDELAPFSAGRGYRLPMSASVNGTPHGGGSWAVIHWSFEQMLAYASRGTRLVPGDIIGSGTVGTGCILELAALHGGQRFPWLRPGDVVRLEVAELGVLTGRVTEGKPPIPL